MTFASIIAIILSMDYSFLNQLTPGEIEKNIVANVRARRKEKKISQVRLSEKAGVSLGSIKRFEQTGEIALRSLIKIGIALEYEDDFMELFSKKVYNSIEEVLNDNNR